jgi:hypothetical protein
MQKTGVFDVISSINSTKLLNSNQILETLSQFCTLRRIHFLGINERKYFKGNPCGDRKSSGK